MPSINKLINYNLSTSNDGGGIGGGVIVSKNLWYWGDESSMSTGSGYWLDKTPNNNDAVLQGTDSDFYKSGSIGFSFNGSNNWLDWSNSTSSFGAVNNGYTIQFTFSPNWSTGSVLGYNAYNAYSLWSAETTNATTIGLPYMYINDICPTNPSFQGTPSLFISNTDLSQGNFLRNTEFYATASAQNINLAFVFDSLSSQSGSIDVYRNGQFLLTGDPMILNNIELIAQFGKPNVTAINNNSAPTNCTAAVNTPINYYKGTVRDILIYERPLASSEVLKNYLGVNQISTLNNL